MVYVNNKTPRLNNIAAIEEIQYDVEYCFSLPGWRPQRRGELCPVAPR